MTGTALTIIEPGIGGWRSADIERDSDGDGLPTDLRFHDDAALSPLDAVFAARITAVDTTNDLAFADLGGGLSGCMNLRRAKALVKGAVTSISDCVSEGQRLLVQVVAEPSTLDTKAYTITPRPRLLGRYVVVEAGNRRLNFSKDLSPKVVKKLTAELTGATDGVAVIVRSSAAGVATSVVVAEVRALAAVFAASPERTGPEKTGQIFARSPLEKALLSTPAASVNVQIEGGTAFAEAKATAQKHWPDLVEKLSLYKGAQAAFEHYGVNEAIEEALGPRIDLPSGGWISITETPALTGVDVNLGNAHKGRSASDAKVLVNLEAALATLYHLRFQDIGGLVVVDFIDMTAKGATRELMQLIEKTARTDRVPLQHTGISTFGMVEFARKRSGVSLKGRMQVTLPARMRASSVALDLLRRGERIGQGPGGGNGALIVSGPESVIGWLKAHPNYVNELSTRTKRTVELMLGANPDVFLRS